MTPRELLDAFDVLAEAPNGIARLRELVLQLAVRGKLVPQDPSDRPATDRFKLRHSPSPDGLPSGWAHARLDELVRFSIGRTPPTKDSTFWASSGAVGSYPWVSIADMIDGDNISETSRSVTRRAYEQVFRGHIVPAGTLLMSFKLTIGKVSRLSMDAFHNEAIVSIHCTSKALDEYLFRTLPYFVRSGDTNAAIKGSTLNKASLSKLAIAVPPEEEQARIVARVDELMALIDQFEQARLRRESARVAFRDASLAELRDSETAEELGYAWQHISHRLESMLTSGEDASGLRDSVLELAATGRLPHRGSVAGKTAEAPCSLPEGWRWARLGDVLKEGPTNGWSPQAVEHVTSIKTLKLSATTRGEFDGRYFKYVDAPAEVVEKFWLEPDDILIQRSNTPEYVGIAARFDGSHRTFIYPDLMMRCRVTADVLPSFVHLCLNAPYNRTWFRARASGTSQSMVKLNQANVRSAWIPVPPLDVQRDIVASVKRFGSLIDSVAQAAQRASNTAARIASAFADPSSWDSPQG